MLKSPSFLIAACAVVTLFSGISYVAHEVYIGQGQHLLVQYVKYGAVIPATVRR